MGVDSIADVFVVVVEDVAGTEAEGWATGVGVFPVVVGVCDSQVACILY